MSDYSMGYFGGGDGYGADDEYEEQDYYQPPQQRQQNAPRSPGLRAAMKAMKAEIAALKKERDESRAMLDELTSDDNAQMPGSPAYGHPRSPVLTQEEQQQYTRMAAMGVVGVAPPMGSQEEQIRNIRAAQSPMELMAYLASQGNTNGTANYNGQGW